jgi:hypothetical protein
VDTEVATAVSQTTAVAIRGAVGLGAANLDTQLSAIDDYVDGEIAAILSAVQLFAGTADGGTVATLEDAALNQADTNYWAFGAAIRFTSGNLAGQTRCVDSFTPGGSAALAFSPPVSQPVSTHDYLLIPAPACDPFR